MSDHAHNYDKEVDPKQKKPCRACTDFQSWMQMKQKGESSPKSKPASAKSVTTDAASDLPKPVECPVDKDELGRNSWSFLHTMAAYYPDKPTAAQQSDMKTFIRIFSKFYPCEPCAADMREDLKDSPPDTSSQKQLSLWFCKLHNKVNKKLGKPEFNCDLVDERWRDGWKDGSCD